MKAIRRLKTQSKDAKIMPICEYVLKFDGSSKGNPGLAGAGAVIYKNNEEISAIAKFVGLKTNNQSEYSALIIGLKEALKQGINHLCVLGDSLLVINQVNGIYKVNAPLLLNLWSEVNDLKGQFEYIEFNHIYREFNVRADELSNLALINIDLELNKVELNQVTKVELNQVTEVELNQVEPKVTEDSIEEIKIDNPSVKKRTRIKQLKIQQFFKINTLFPEI